MRPIQMVDLKGQYSRIQEDVDLAIRGVLESTAFINGKPVGDFSQALGKYLGINHVIPCANGTDALQIALMGLGLEPGDEVITPSFTFIATTEVVALLHLKPVFADVDPKTFCLDPVSLEKQITKKTKVIVPVHLYGQSAPMKAIIYIRMGRPKKPEPSVRPVPLLFSLQKISAHMATEGPCLLPTLTWRKLLK